MRNKVISKIIDFEINDSKTTPSSKILKILDEGDSIYKKKIKKLYTGIKAIRKSKQRGVKNEKKNEKISNLTFRRRSFFNALKFKRLCFSIIDEFISRRSSLIDTRVLKKVKNISSVVWAKQR